MESKVLNAKLPNFTHMVLGGGGMLGTVYIGAFRYLYENPELIVNIKTVIGTSIGAFFAIAFVLNISISDIEIFWNDFLNENTKKFDINIIQLFDIFSTLGLDDSSRAFEIIIKNLNNITFLDLAKKTGKDLIICATNAHTMKGIYFSVNNTPNVMVSDALHASCSLPLIKKPVKIGDTYYIDGGVTENIPISCIPDNIDSNNILIFSLDGSDIDPLDKLNLPLLLINILQIIIKNKPLITIYKKKYKYFIEFLNIPIKAVEYIVKDDKIYICTSSEKLDKCFEIGYETMYSKIKELTVLNSNEQII